MYGDLQECSQKDFYAVFNITNTEADPSAIASDPYKVCMCENDKHQPNCSRREYSVSVFPGQVFSLRLAVVSAGPFVGVVRGAIHAYFNSQGPTLGSSQESQIGRRPRCENYNFSIFGTENDTVILGLAPEQHILELVKSGDYTTI